MYWYQFLTRRGLTQNTDANFSIYSVFGPREIIPLTKTDINLFFSGENLSLDNYSAYSDHLLNCPDIHLSMGFDYISHPKYIRFPLWMDYMFPADSSYKDIRKICTRLRFPDTSNNINFCCQVSSHDINGLRGHIIEQLDPIQTVFCAGKFHHNDDTLKYSFNDIKSEYLKTFIFNICPENSDTQGYVTEKIFEAISSGCIPIYWGSGNNPEPEIINKDAVIFADKNGLSSSQLSFIQDLLDHPALLKDFQSQPRILLGSEDLIEATFESIELRIKTLLSAL